MTDFPTSSLLNWYKKHQRNLPWRKTSDPYKIWISEIMLQQTRVDTVIPYYNRFLEAFPTVQDLAEADQQKVLKLWEGLGYYSRARNMHQAAKTVHKKFNGKFPKTYSGLMQLKGIGPYTAAAVSSIAFQKKQAVVDGNVIRVLCRFYGIEDNIRLTSTKKEVQNLADKLIPDENPGDFNQAVMELGAIVCSPAKARCGGCPLSVNCSALSMAKTETIPYKSKKKKVPHHQIAVGIIINQKNQLLIALRPNDAMLGGLWEFPGGKKEKQESLPQTVKRELKEELGVDVNVYSRFMKLNHAYSHFKITLHAYWCGIQSGTPGPRSSQELKWVHLHQIDQYPFPKANKTLIENLKKLENQNLLDFLDQ